MNFVTNFAQDVQALNNLARDSFGIRFLNPGDELETLMNEDTSNSLSFQPLNSSEPLLFRGDISSEEFNIADLDFSSLQDGYIEIKLDVIDPNGNPGEETHIAYYLIAVSYTHLTLPTI